MTFANQRYSELYAIFGNLDIIALLRDSLLNVEYILMNVKELLSTLQLLEITDNQLNPLKNYIQEKYTIIHGQLFITIGYMLHLLDLAPGYGAQEGQIRNALSGILDNITRIRQYIVFFTLQHNTQ